MDELALELPEYGSRRYVLTLDREGHRVGRDRVRGLIQTMGLRAVYPRPRTSQPGKGHRIYPYLLRGREIKEADEVWCTDITYIPMARGYAYLVAVMDWKSRAVLSWKLSNTADTRFCLEAFGEALQRAGRAPAIFNTDQGSQFTSEQWIHAVESAGSRVSMDGKGRWVDNVFIERLWRAVKHEGIYLWAYENLHQLERALAKWLPTTMDGSHTPPSTGKRLGSATAHWKRPSGGRPHEHGLFHLEGLAGPYRGPLTHQP